MQSNHKHKLTLIVECCFLVIAGYMLLGRVASIFTYNPNISGVEEVFVFYIQNLLSGAVFYPNPSEPPYIISQYTPIFFYVTAFFAKLFRLDPEQNLTQIFWMGRSISFIANLFTFVYIVKLVKLFRPIRLSYTGLLFILYFGTLTHHSFATRPDSLKVCFLIAGFYYLVSYLFNQKIRVYLSAVVLFCLAIFTKQDAVLESGIILSVFLLFFSTNRKKDLVTTVGVFLISGIVFYLCFRNQYLEVLFIKSKEHISLNYFKLIFTAYHRHAIVLALMLFFGYAALGLTAIKQRPLVFIAVVLFPMAIYNVVSVAMWGSSFVYVSTTIILSITLLFIVNRKAIAFLFVGFTIIFLVKTDIYYTYYIKERASVEAPYILEHEQRKQIKGIIEKDNPTGDYKTLTFDKLLSNYLFETSIFPTYEAEGIEYYYYGSVPMDEYKYFKKFDYNTKYLVDNNEPKYLITNHESQLKLDYNSVRADAYSQIGQVNGFRVLKRN
ncbi:MAG: glycosyltransferase family 39 protein [Chitinophagales bacterium]